MRKVNRNKKLLFVKGPVNILPTSKKPEITPLVHYTTIYYNIPSFIFKHTTLHILAIYLLSEILFTMAKRLYHYKYKNSSESKIIDKY